MEAALAGDARRVLIAMATGTGKTRTCLGLICRLLKAQRAQRVLFVVDREFLATQAAETFKKVKVDEQKAFADIYTMNEVDVATPDEEARLHITTVQGLIRRILFAAKPGDGDASKLARPPSPLSRALPPRSAYRCPPSPSPSTFSPLASTSRPSTPWCSCAG